MNIRLLSAFLALTCLVWLTGCNMPSGGAGPNTWIDAPLDGTTVPIAPLVVRSHAASEGGTAQAALLVDGAQVRVDQAVDGAGKLIEFAQAWTPPGPGQYLLQVISIDHAGNEGRSNTVRVIVAGEVAAPPTDTPMPVTGTPPTSSVTPSATGVSGPTFTFDKNGNCRLGASTAHEVVTSFLAGQQLPIEGRNEDNSWFWLLIPGGGHCFASVGTGFPQGPYATTAVIASPALPVATTEAAPPPLEPPASPGKFNVQELQCDASNYIVRLSWQDVTGEDGYRVYRDGSLIDTTSSDANSYDDTLPDYNSHSYRVEAFNGSGTGSTGSKNSTGCLY